MYCLPVLAHAALTLLRHRVDLLLDELDLLLLLALVHGGPGRLALRPRRERRAGCEAVAARSADVSSTVLAAGGCGGGGARSGRLPDATRR